MHRINLRGPWEFSLDKGSASCTRRFHAPKGFAEESAAQVNERIWFSLLCYPNKSPSAIAFNAIEMTGEIQSQVYDPSNDRTNDFAIHNPSIPRVVIKIELSTILAAFNTIELQWQSIDLNAAMTTSDPPQSRYVPGYSHPFHLDSWLEIYR